MLKKIFSILLFASPNFAVVSCANKNITEDLQAFDIKNIRGSLIDFINNENYKNKPWEVEDLQNKIRLKYSDPLIKVEKINKDYFSSVTKNMEDIYLVSGQKEDYGNGHYFGNLKLTHNWKQKTDTTIDINNEKELTEKINQIVLQSIRENSFDKESFLIELKKKITELLDEFVEVKLFESNDDFIIGIECKGDENNFGKYNGSLIDPENWIINFS